MMKNKHHVEGERRARGRWGTWDRVAWQTKTSVRRKDWTPLMRRFFDMKIDLVGRNNINDPWYDR